LDILFSKYLVMFTSFFKVAFRILVRDKLNTLINIFGLAIGLAFSIIIFLYVYQETSYDRFHRDAERIFRIGIKGNISDNRFNHAVTPAPLAVALKQEVPGVENSVRVARFGAWLVRRGNVGNNEDNIIFADRSFFSVFSFPLISGNAEDVLSRPNSIVLSRSKATTYFGNDEPVGKLLRIENDSTYYRVTGVMEDVPENSHIHFDMIGSLSTFSKMLHEERWVINYVYTYFKAKPGITVDTLNAAIQALIPKYVLPDYRKFLGMDPETSDSSKYSYNFVIQPITDIHLRSTFTNEFEPVGNILYVYLFTALAIIILVLSCVNFISLTTARSADRAREVSIRKIAGSEKNILIRQFLIESSVLAFLSMLLALFITELCLPAFNHYMELDLRLSQLLNSSGVLLMIGLILVIGIFSGLYPALHFSSFEPLDVLHNHHRKFSGRTYFRSGLVLFQLFISIGVITMTGIVMGQYKYLVHKDLGFDKENLLVIRRPDGLKNQLEEYKKQISRYAGVISVTNSTSIPGSIFPRIPYYLEGNPVTRNYAASHIFISYGFDSTYQLSITSGRFFDRNHSGDSSACVINESMANILAEQGLVGKNLVQLAAIPWKTHNYKIIGIVKDFNYEVLENPVTPLVMVLMPGNLEGYLTVRLHAGDPAPVIQNLKSTWEKYTTAYPFVSYFLDRDLQNRYNRVRETGRIFSVLSIVAMLIACLGLFGLVSYAYSRRGFELGVRKAMGADPGTIILFEVRNIILLLLVSSTLAWMGVYFLVDSWLSGYAYKISLNALYFFIPFTAVLLISLFTIYYQAYIAAHSNPAPALKYE
jgi:putative ABC transport system permease protein